MQVACHVACHCSSPVMSVIDTLISILEQYKPRGEAAHSEIAIYSYIEYGICNGIWNMNVTCETNNPQSSVAVVIFHPLSSLCFAMFMLSFSTPVAKKAQPSR